MNTIEMTMSSSKTVGVRRVGNKWRARITVDGIIIHIEMYSTEAKAVEAALMD